MPSEVTECPFCGWEADEGYLLPLVSLLSPPAGPFWRSPLVPNVASQHIESLHAEGELYSRREKAQASTMKEEEEGQYAECPVAGCGEVLLVDELDYHLELHEQEVADMDHASQGQVTKKQGQRDGARGSGTEPSPSPRRQPSPGHTPQREKQPAASGSRSGKQQTAIAAWKNILSMPMSNRRLTDAEKRGAAIAMPGKRLGVSPVGISTWCAPWLTTHCCREPISASTHTRNVCQTGSSICSRHAGR